MRKLLFTISFFAGLSLLYNVWSNYGKVSNTSELPKSQSPSLTIIEVGEKGQAGNLIGIQPFMEPMDYASEEKFYQKLNSYLLEAKVAGLINAKSVVVFPEHIGTWLVAANEKTQVYKTGSSQEALQLAALSNVFKFVSSYLWAEAEHKVNAAIFTMKADQTATMYNAVFKKLAIQYKITIVAGSVFLPSPRVVNGNIEVGGNPIYNASFVFFPNGSIAPQVIQKQFPINEELGFCKADTSEASILESPLGKLGVVICADSWYPSVYSNLSKQEAEVIAIPSFSSPNGLWRTKWKGYNGSEMPVDVNAEDVDKITEGEAWLKYSMGGRSSKTSSIKLGINVFLRGNIWDLGDDGHTIVYKNGKVFTSPFYDGPQITVVWK